MPKPKMCGGRYRFGVSQSKRYARIGREKRQLAEVRIRTFVQEAAQDGGRAIVVPYRIQGFGPYAKMLDGLSYASDGKGLIPSVEIEHWVRRQARELKATTFRSPLAEQDAQAQN